MIFKNEILEIWKVLGGFEIVIYGLCVWISLGCLFIFFYIIELWLKLIKLIYINNIVVFCDKVLM